VNGTSYYQCGSTCDNRTSVSGDLFFVVVDAPPGYWRRGLFLGRRAERPLSGTITAVLRLSPLVLRLVVSLILTLAILRAAAALWIDGPESRALAGTLAGGLVLIALTAAVLVRPWRRAGDRRCRQPIRSTRNRGPVAQAQFG
jgi:hypothetical protein